MPGRHSVVMHASSRLNGTISGNLGAAQLPVKVVLRVPTKMKEMRVPFEMKDFVLP